MTTTKEHPAKRPPPEMARAAKRYDAVCPVQISHAACLINLRRQLSLARETVPGATRSENCPRDRTHTKGIHQIRPGLLCRLAQALHVVPSTYSSPSLVSCSYSVRLVEYPNGNRTSREKPNYFQTLFHPLLFAFLGSATIGLPWTLGYREMDQQGRMPFLLNECANYAPSRRII